MESDTQHI